MATSLTDLEETVEAMTARPLVTTGERKALEEQASSGELGGDMQTPVEKIQGGEDTWEQVFSGESPDATLLQDHLASLVEEHTDDIAMAFEELIESEEARGNFFLDEVPASES